MLGVLHVNPTSHLVLGVPTHISIQARDSHLDSHQVKARSGHAALATGLGKFAAGAGGGIFADVIGPRDEMVIDPAAAYGGLAELDSVELGSFEI